MFDRGCDIVFLQLLDVRFAERRDLFGIGTERSRVGNGVAEVIIDVDDRSERPVDTERGSLFSDHAGEFPRIAGIVRRGDPEFATYPRAAQARLIEPCFEIGGNEKRDLCVFLQALRRIAKFVETHRSRHHAADFQIGSEMFQIAFVVGIGDQTEKLTDLFFRRHAGNGRLNPVDVTVRKTERFCFQIKHTVPAFRVSRIIF